MHSYELTIRLQHTDAFGIIFFPNQLVFCYEAFQSWLDDHGMALPPSRCEADEVLVVVRAESDYLAPVRLGDRLRVRFGVESMGTTSVIHQFVLERLEGQIVGRARTVHVLIDAISSAKRPLGPRWRQALQGNPLTL